MTKAEIKEEAMKREQSADFSLLFSAFEKMSEFNGVSSAYGMGFCHGAMWARREGWKSVEAELPPYDESVIVTDINDTDGDMCFCHRSDNPMVKTDENGFCNYAKMKITHWMHCPLPPKKED